MIKKAAPLLLTFIMVICLFSGCAPKKGADGSPNGGERTYADYIDSGVSIAVQTGDVFADVAKDIFHAKNMPEYTSAADMLEALRLGKTDAALLSSAYVDQIIDSGTFPDFDYLWVPTDIYVNESAPIFRTEELRDKYNAWFDTIVEDGAWEEMENRWLRGSLPTLADIPTFELTGENGTLKMCNTGNYAPLCYFGENGELTGLDVELMSRFAQYMGMGLEIATMSYDAIVPYVLSGKADMSACTLTITDEREEGIIFGTPSVITQAVLIVPKSDNISEKTELDYTDFIGKKLGHKTGSIWDQILPEHLQAELAYYSDVSAGVEDVRKGRIDGYVTDLSAVRTLVAAEGNEDLVCVEIPAEIFSGPMGAVSLNQDIIGRFNAFLAEIKADGTLEDMQNRWLDTVPDLDSPMPDIPLSGANGTLRVATTAGALPFSYMGANGELKGYSVELAKRFAAHEGMDIEFVEMEFGGMIPYVISGKAELAIADISITEERKKSVLFTDSIYDDKGGIIALKTGDTAPATLTRYYTDFEGKSIGVATGTIWDQLTEDGVNATPVYYTEMSAAIEDVRKGRIDGYMADLSEARVFTAQADKADLEYIEIPFEIFASPMGAISNNQDMIDRFNVFLAEIKADGTLADMQSRWLENIPDLDSPMPDIPLTGENGTLKYAASGTALPFSYFGSDNELKGYSVELAIRFASHEGMGIEFETVGLDGFIAYMAAGKADIYIDAVSITEERKQSVLFSDSIYDDQAALIVLRQTGEGTASVHDYTDFAGEKLANITGVLTYITTEKIGGTPVYYSENSAAIEDVRLGRVEGFMYTLSFVRAMVASPGNEDMEAIPVPTDFFSAEVAGISMSQDVIDRFNAFLAEVTADGTLDKMKERWLSGEPDLDSPMPVIESSGENGVLRVVTCSSTMPYAYMGGDGELKGFSVELAQRFAAYEGKTIEFADVEFAGLIPYVTSEKAELGLANMAITEERKQSVLFTDPICNEQHGILALKDGKADNKESRSGFIGWLKTGIENNLIKDNRWKMVVNGLGVTMIISFASQILGTLFGTFVCYLLTRKSRLAQWIGNFYCGLIHGTPAVVLLVIAYYIMFGNTNISNVLVAIAAFTMIQGAIIGQTLHGAIDTVDPVEIEAARSIGFSTFRAFTAVTLPQAVRRALPPYLDGFVEQVKATAIVGYIAIQDLMRAGDIIRSRTYDAYFPILFVAAIYLVVTAICVQVCKLAVKKINGGAAK